MQVDPMPAPMESGHRWVHCGPSYGVALVRRILTNRVAKIVGFKLSQPDACHSYPWGTAAELRFSVESFRQGHPRFSALIAANESFYVCRKFSRARARLLLLKHDKVVMLQDKLEAIDRAETKSLFLGASRLDTNPERSSTLCELDHCLADLGTQTIPVSSSEDGLLMWQLDSFVDRTIRVLNRKPASSRARDDLRNWLNTKGCIPREESAFLEDADDLMELKEPSDGVMAQLEGWVEDSLVHFIPGFRKVRLPTLRPSSGVGTKLPILSVGHTVSHPTRTYSSTPAP
jgi:hypothetical protein